MATVQGNRGPEHRLGSKQSGIKAIVNGWNLGVTVEGQVREDNDVFELYITCGSSGRSSGIYIGTVESLPDGTPMFRPAGP